jgi:hypothetical protein
MLMTSARALGCEAMSPGQFTEERAVLMIRGRLGIRASVAAQLSLEKGERPKEEPKRCLVLPDGTLGTGLCSTEVAF